MRRFGLSEREQELVWGAGGSLRALAVKLGARPKYVHLYVASTGGIRPVPRRRSGRCLSKLKLELKSSPEQISAWLRQTYRDDPGMQVSHETSYLSLFVQSRGALRRELCAHLRRGRVNRRPRAHRQGGKDDGGSATW